MDDLFIFEQKNSRMSSGDGPVLDREATGSRLAGGTTLVLPFAGVTTRVGAAQRDGAPITGRRLHAGFMLQKELLSWRTILHYLPRAAS